MNLMNIILLVIFFILLININKDNKININNSKNTATQYRKLQKNIPEDIMINNRGIQPTLLGEFPIPQSTTISNNLSPTYPENLSLITNGSTILNNDSIIESRRNGIDTISDSRFPKYFRKDNMSGSTIGTTEYAFAEVDNTEPSYAWQDKNVSQYPTYYTTDDKGGLTDPGAFFDKNNQYVDLTGSRSEANIGDVCYTSKEGERICLENDKLQNVPPSLISDKHNCGFLNSIGLLEFSNSINESTEKVSNGGFLYDQVQGSMKHNERYSKPIQQPISSCQL